MNKWEMDREQMEQAIADKMNEIVDIFDGWHGHDASELTISIGKDKVWGYIFKENEKNPLDFSKERKARRATGRLFTEEIGEIIGKAAKDCLFRKDAHPGEDDGDDGEPDDPGTGFACVVFHNG